MKRNVSNHSYRDEKLRSSHSENYETGLRRTEEERLRRRREWIVEQQMLREHERLKKKKILEYEIRRALEKGLPLPKERFSHHSSNTSESKSPESQHRTVATLSTSNTSILSKKLEPSDGTTPLFKGPEGIQVTAAELRRIKVYIHRNSFTEDIHRNVSDEATDDLQRDIINFEDVLVKRREGEGSKSIFEREEIKSVTAKTEEIVEHRTVVAINNENLENKPEANKEYTTSSRSRSPPYRSSHHTRYMLCVTIVCFVLAYTCFFFFWMYWKWKLGEKGIKIQNIITGIVTEMIETEIIVEVEVESIKKKSGHIVNCTLQRKNTCEKEIVIEIIHIQREENKEHGSKILITATSHLNTKDLIEKNRESDSEKEEKEISLENVGYLHHIILNPFLFLFIMEVFLRDQ